MSPAAEIAKNPVLELTRYFAHDPERVFDAWLDPAAVGRWLFATLQGEMQPVELDPRVGGRFRIAEQRGETLVSHVGEYLELDRPRRLVFHFGIEPTDDEPEEPPSLVTVEIEPAAGGCVLRLLHEIDPKWADWLEQTREGWSKILDGLTLTFDGALELTLRRLFDAPRAQVFSLWSSAEHMKHWFGPKNFTIPELESDFRPGGAWSSSMVGPDGKGYRLGGVYREIDAGERIVFTQAWRDDDDQPGPETLVTVTFEDLSTSDGARTLLTFHQGVFETSGARDSHADGWSEVLDRFDRHQAR